MPEISTIIHRHRLRIALAAAALALVFAAVWWRPGFGRRENPQLTTPRLALEALTARAFYFNGPAQPWLLALRPDLLTTEDRNVHSARSRAFAQAVANPTL